VRKYLGGTDHEDPIEYLKSHGISESQFRSDVQRALQVLRCCGQLPLHMLLHLLCMIFVVNQVSKVPYQRKHL
ncbi:hypothetical protein ACUOFC_46505, partial [Escherichia sp. TWPC-MK]